ncbi:hypothetical protein KR009_006519 [Drosophila setifemur]|nr:hypothetical protein KR009_006519 [Drosophila setifemur]
MKCLTLLALSLLATLAFVQAGKVSIKGECVNCSHDHPVTTTTHKPTPTRGRAVTTTPKSKAKPKGGGSPARRRPSSDEDDDLDGWSLHQSGGGTQHISRRYRRQWGGGQYIDLGGSGGGGGGRGWTGNGPVTTIDSRGYPGTLVRNSDCVGCNIRG